MTKIIELRPSRDLLNNSFEKYQFCDVPTPIEPHELKTNVFRKEINLDQNSLLEAQIFAYHNHLFTNPYDNSCWFIDSDKQVWRFCDNKLQPIYKLEGDLNDLMFNPSMAFTSNNIVAILNGNKSLEMLILKNDENTVKCIYTDIEPGILLDIRYTNASIIVAIQNVTEIDSKKQSEIRLYTFACKTSADDVVSIANLIRKQICQVNGAVEYLFIEENGNYIQVASQSELAFKFDSMTPVEEDSSSSAGEAEVPKVPRYSWSQDEETISVWVRVPEKVSASKENVDVTLNSVTVTVGGVILVEGITSNNVEPSLTTWRRKDDLIEIDLTKQDAEVMWSELIVGDKSGEYLPNASSAAEIHSRLSHLCTDKQEKGDGTSAIGFNAEQLEDCDLEGKENFVQRINLNTHKQTHLIMIRQSNCILLNQKFKNRQAVGMRYDHDGCIWIFGNGDEDNWNMEHKYTFPGFGYIEASKKCRKFCVFSSDGSYIAILEHLRHIFIYEKTEKNAKISKQRVIDLNTEFPILGASVINQTLYVLTTNTLYQLNIHQ